MELAALCSAVKLYGRIETLAMLLDRELPKPYVTMSVSGVAELEW
jgi:hypothetical protein